MNRRFPLVLALTLTLVPLRATAEPPDPATLSEEERTALGRLFTEARSEYEAEDYAAAVETLLDAYQLFPDPNILYRIGDAYENAGELEQAVRYYERYLAEAVDAPDRGLVGRRVVDLRRRLVEAERPEEVAPAKSHLVLDSDPIGATIRIDGEVSGSTPARVEVEAGTRAVSLTLDGYETIRRDVAVDAGETISLVYPLDPLAVEAPPSAPRWPLWVGGAGGVVLAAGGAAWLVSALAAAEVRAWDAERDDAYQAGEPPPPRPDGYDVTARRTVHARYVAIAATSVGAALVGTALVGLWLTDDAQVAVGPRGITISGAF